MADDTITNRRILNIALPIVLSNITVPILGLVDTAVIGQLGQAVPIGAVGIGASILSAIFWLFSFLRMGTTGLTSQAKGAGRTGEVAAMLTRALMIGLAGGLGIVLLQGPLIQAALQLSPASAEVETLAQDYIRIRIWSAPAMIALFGINGWLIALERTRAVLALQIVMNSINILLDLWFVLGFEWGVSGVAWATVTAETSGFLFGLWLCRDAFRVPAWRDRARVLDAAALKNMAVVNFDILLRSLMLEVIFLSFIFLGSGFGDVTLAANHVLLQFLAFCSFALDGFAFSAETLVGQAMGARDRMRLRRAAVTASKLALVGVVLLALAFAVAGGPIIDLITKAPKVQAEARHYLPYVVLVPIFGLPPFMLDGIFIGATRTRDMRNMMVLSLLIYGGAVLALMPLLGNHGLWLALLVHFVARGATLAWRYPALEARVQGR